MNKKKILIICMTRMGDLVQMIPLTRALKERENVSISVLARDAFSKILENIETIDEIITYDTQEMTNIALAEGKEKYNEELKAWISDIAKRNFNEVINLTFTASSALIGSLLNVPVQKAYSFADDGTQVFNNKWSQYIQGNVQNKTINTINLVDIFLNMNDFDTFNFIDKKAGPANKIYRIAFQLGASRKHKQWPVESFVGLAECILNSNEFEKEKLELVLIGSKQEESLAEEFLKLIHQKNIEASKINNQVGKSNIEDLWQNVSTYNMLVTNDTGTMHVAAMQDVPTLLISLGPTNPHETGPYSTNAVIITPNISCFPCSVHAGCMNNRCKLYIKPTDVFKALCVLDKMQFDIFNNDEDKIKLQDTNCLITIFKTIKIKNDGLAKRLQLVPINKPKVTKRSMSEVICACSFKRDMTFDQGSLDRILLLLKKYSFSGFSFKDYYDDWKDDFQLLRTTLSKAIKINLQMLKLSKKDGDMDLVKVKKLQKLTDSLKEVDLSIIGSSKIHQIKAFLCGFLRARLSNNLGSLHEQIKNQVIIYRDALRALNSVDELIESLKSNFQMDKDVLFDSAIDDKCDLDLNEVKK